MGTGTTGATTPGNFFLYTDSYDGLRHGYHSNVILSIWCSIMPIKHVLEARPDLCLLAEYPSEGRLDGSPNKPSYFFGHGFPICY